MSDRLKQIWSGFETQTSRHLTGQGIDNIHVPSRREWRADDTKFLSGDFEAPADRAFTALEYKLAAAASKHGRRKTRFNPDTRIQAQFGAEGDPERSAYGPSAESLVPRMPSGDPAQALLASLRETDFCTLRREISYSADASGMVGRKIKRGRKKFLGLL